MTNTNNVNAIFSTSNVTLYKDEAGAITIRFTDSWGDEVTQPVTFTADDCTCNVPLSDESIKDLSSCVNPYTGEVGAEETFHQSVENDLLNADVDYKDASAVADFLTEYYAEQIAEAEAALAEEREEEDND